MFKYHFMQESGNGWHIIFPNLVILPKIYSVHLDNNQKAI